MAVRRGKDESITDFLGLNTLADATNLQPNAWIESNNIIVSADGSAVALRSPKAVNNVPGTAAAISAFSWTRTAGSKVIWDTTTDTYATQPGISAINNLIRANANTSRWKRLNVNDKAYGINGFEALQIEPAANAVYKIGIDPPAAAPTASIVAGGTLVLNVGVTVSYAYRNSVTLHVGKCSAASANSGPTGANQTLRTAVVASAQAGVDGIVLFITTDGGANRFLLVDSAGAPRVFANSTANIDITAPFFLDTNTIETAFSARPADDAVFMFSHQSRVFMCGYASAAKRWYATYSGLEAIGIGQPTEAFPPLNIVALPSKNDFFVGGISTSLGALIMSDHDSYLLQGPVTDNVVSAQNTIQATPILQALKWGVGTKSPLTICETPFGIIWLDQSKRIQLWPFQGLPKEIGLPLRNELKTIGDSSLTLPAAEAVWFQYGEMQYYVLTARTAVTDKLFIIGVYEDPESRQVRFVTAVSDIAAKSIIVHTNPPDIPNNATYCMILRQENPVTHAADGGLKSILDLDTAGDGWGASQTIYFGVTTGNFKDNGNYNYVHSIRFDAATNDVRPSFRNFNDSDVETFTTEAVDLAYFALLDRYGVHGKLKFAYPTDDIARRDVKNLRITYASKGRVI